MRVGINLLYLLPGIVGGTETYARGLLHGLALLDSGHEFVVFVNRTADQWPIPGGSFVRVICPVDGSNRRQRYAFEQFRLPFMLREHHVDLVHSLGYVGPIMSPCPAVVTIPDTNYIDLASSIPARRRFPLRIFSTIAAKRASSVITISDFSRQQIIKLLGLPQNKIVVTRLAPQLGILKTLNDLDSCNIQSCYNIERSYIVAFGGGAIHKNIPRLLQAFAQIAGKIDHQLVLIGHLPPDYNVDVLEKTPGLLSRVVTTGYVPSDHIGPLLRHADLFVMPTLYEGFGLPVLEAQQAGTVVACSTAGSLPEVAGAGAAFFDPLSVDSMAEIIFRCIVDSELRARLYQEGQENLKRFSWEKTAKETLAVYHKVLA
ncbi:MAG: glycosyl transferase family 1 [Chloroflexota bacterium]|jgi:glycosyltransferase involved in cell wall biosynthesis|nr:glycosyltransferase family 4 protein [Caldilinea sp.]GIK74003.1 MAG: glycosyl transferase family 1 [Chloroflexota bacterium]